MRGKSLISIILAGVGVLALLEYNNKEEYPLEYEYLFSEDAVTIRYDNYNIRNSKNEVVFEDFNMSYQYMSDKNIIQYLYENGTLSFKARCLFNFKGFYSNPLLAEYLLLTLYDEIENTIATDLENLLSNFILYVNEGYVKININYGNISNDRLFELVNEYYELIMSDENLSIYIEKITNNSLFSSYSDLYNDLLNCYKAQIEDEYSFCDSYEFISLFNANHVVEGDYIRYISNSNNQYLVSSNFSFESIVTNPLLAEVVFLCNLRGDNNYLTNFIVYCEKGYLLFDSVDFSAIDIENAINNTIKYMENGYNSDYYLEEYIDSYQRVKTLPSNIAF